MGFGPNTGGFSYSSIAPSLATRAFRQPTHSSHKFSGRHRESNGSAFFSQTPPPKKKHGSFSVALFALKTTQKKGYQLQNKKTTSQKANPRQRIFVDRRLPCQALAPGLSHHLPLEFGRWCAMRSIGPKNWLAVWGSSESVQFVL